MSSTAERYRKVAGQFTRTADGVPDGAWDTPAPCEGWVARGCPTLRPARRRPCG